jgi:CheY-like chemotaxis protein
VTRILLVEDEIAVLILSESVVKGLGYETFSAGSVTEALTLLDEHQPIHTLFTDIRLPESDLGGLELAQEARGKDGQLKVLYTTGDVLTDGMKAMFVEGGKFLPKPYTADDLSAALQELIDNKG